MGYPLLLEQEEKLRKEGVQFFSAVEIFDREAALVYSDDCCHLTQRGIEIFSDFILKNLALSLSETNRKSPQAPSKADEKKTN